MQLTMICSSMLKNFILQTNKSLIFYKLLEESREITTKLQMLKRKQLLQLDLTILKEIGELRKTLKSKMILAWK